MCIDDSWQFKKSIKIKEILEPDIVKDEDIDIQWAFVSDKELIVPCYFTHSSIKNFMEYALLYWIANTFTYDY